MTAMPNDQVMIDRELLVELRDAASECLDREDRQRRQMIYSRLVSDSDAILAQPAPSDGVEVVAYLLQHESGARLVDLNSQSIQVAQQEHGGIVHKLVMLEAHNAEVARLREDRDSHQRECIKALAGYDSLRGDAAALVKKCLDEERECWTGDSRQAVHLALDDAYARVLIALSQQSTP